MHISVYKWLEGKKCGGFMNQTNKYFANIYIYFKKNSEHIIIEKINLMA